MENDMTKTAPEENKALVLEAFDTLFNKRDYEAAARFWSEIYIQHSAHIEPGRDGLFKLIRSAPETLRYEHQLIVAEAFSIRSRQTNLRSRLNENHAIIAADTTLRPWQGWMSTVPRLSREPHGCFQRDCCARSNMRCSTTPEGDLN
jgi:hypothetical protein